MDTLVEKAVWLHRGDGQVLKFVECAGGLYAYDRTNSSHKITTHIVNTQTVEFLKAQYTRRQVQRADKACDLIWRLAYPSQAQVEKLISNNFFHQNDLLVNDFRQANTIYGPMVEVLKGKGIRDKPQHIPSTAKTVLLSYILTEHRDVTLTADFLVVSGNFFLHTKSRKLHFRTVVPVQDRKKATILKHIKTAFDLHNTRGFLVNELIADIEFACIKDQIIPVSLNLVARGEHCGDIENSIKFLKERLRCLWNGLPFRCMPRVMITAGIGFCNNMINALPAGDGISDTLSSATIVTGRAAPNVANLQLNFGDFVQLQMNNKPTNTMRSRHIGCITLHPTGSTQGSHYFMDLHSGKRQHGWQWTQCVMTDDIISRVKALGHAQKQPIMHDGPIVTWRNGDPITPAVVPDVDAVSSDEDADPSNQPLFLPPPPPPLDVDADVAVNVPLRIVQVDVGANIAPDQGAADQGAPDQGAAAQAVLRDNDDDDEIEGGGVRGT